MCYISQFFLNTHSLETKNPPNIKSGRMRIGPAAMALDNESVAVDTK